ncbi:MAG: hypothetical protein ACR2MX_10700 [Cyclobacteriaceae bacterium]
MRKLTLTICLSLLSVAALWAQEYQVVTTVESVVPAGLGRSRIIENKEPMNVADFTTERVNGKKSNQGDVKRKDVKVNNFNESKLLNFYSAVGINFQNIASNDALISSKLNQMVAEGWELAFVLSGVEGDAGETDGHGIFITRYIFKRQ